MKINGAAFYGGVSGIRSGPGWLKYKTFCVQEIEPTKSCTLQNYEILKMGRRVFCYKYYGQKNRSDGANLCKSMNATLPLPRSHSENIQMQKKLTSSSRLYIDVVKTSSLGKVNL